MLDEFLHSHITHAVQDAYINLAAHGIPLQLVQGTAKVGEVLHNELGYHLLIVLHPLRFKDFRCPLQELHRESRLLLGRNAEVNAGASGVQRLNHPVLEVASQDEAAVVRKLFNETAKGGLSGLCV